VLFYFYVLKFLFQFLQKNESALVLHQALERQHLAIERPLQTVAAVTAS
jgi:hypothetical protein